MLLLNQELKKWMIAKWSSDTKYLEIIFKTLQFDNTSLWWIVKSLWISGEHFDDRQVAMTPFK